MDGSSTGRGPWAEIIGMISEGLFLDACGPLDDYLDSRPGDAEDIYRDLVSAAAGALSRPSRAFDDGQVRGLVGMDYSFENALGPEADGFAPSDDVCDIILGRARRSDDPALSAALIAYAERICAEQLIAGDCTAESNALRMGARAEAVRNIIRLRGAGFWTAGEMHVADSAAWLMEQLSSAILKGLEGLSPEQVYEADVWEGDRNAFADAVYDAEEDAYSEAGRDRAAEDIARFSDEFFRPSREMAPGRKAEISRIISGDGGS